MLVSSPSVLQRRSTSQRLYSLAFAPLSSTATVAANQDAELKHLLSPAAVRSFPFELRTEGVRVELQGSAEARTSAAAAAADGAQ